MADTTMNNHRAPKALMPALALLLLLTTAAPAAATEIWVVTEQSREIVVLDADNEAIIDLVDLTGLQEDPYDVAFDTVPGLDGNLAFVTQGPFVVLVDVPSRTPFEQIDVAGLLGLNARLRGIAAARPRAFLDGGGAEVPRSYLYVAAQVTVGAGLEEPWFVVLDQEIASIDPASPSVLVDARPLESAQPGQVLEVMDVDVLSSPAGDRFQRAWFTHREEAPDTRIVATQVAAKRDLAAPLSPVEIREELFPPQSLPDSVTVGVPYDRELPALPLAIQERVINLDTERQCDIPGSNLRDAATAGLGPGSHTVLLANDGTPGTIIWLDPSDCVNFLTFPAQDEPVDIAFDDPIEWNRAFVANRGSDSVTVLRRDQTLIDIPLPGGTTPCTLCPRSAVANLGVMNSCTVRDFTVDDDPTGGQDSQISWNVTGCQSDQSFLVACVCEDAASPDCPPGCGQASLTAGASSLAANNLALETGGPLCDGEWKPLHSTAPGETDYTVPGGGTGLGVCYSVTPRQIP